MATYDHVFVAEKSSLAQAVAEARAEQLGVKARKVDGCWEVGNDRVTWFIGHMYELVKPPAYGERFARYSLDTLPIVLQDNEWKRIPNERTKDQLAKACRVIRDGRILVNVGDAEREGQLLVDEAFVENRIDPFGKNVLRLWVQSVTRKDLLAALANMRPNAEKKTLFDAAWCRQRADWQHGMTYSTEFNIKAQNAGADVKISVGRVQTPTLRLVVDRDRERAKFRPVDHFRPRIVFRHENGTFQARWVVPQEYDGLDSEGRLVDRSVAERIVAKIAGKNGQITDYRSEIKSKAPPLPYSLSALQMDCGNKFHMTAQETLDVAQSLYEKHKATSYPRSDSRHLPTSILRDEAPGILMSLGATEGLKEAVATADPSRKSAAWDDSKVSDHYGIIPTSEFTAAKLAQMTDAERKVFMLIAQTFVAQFHGNFRWRATAADVRCEGETFKANGRQLVDNGWKTVFGAADVDDDDQAEDDSGQPLPQMKVKDPVQAQSGDIVSKTTEPPPAYTDPTLIKDMTSVHRLPCVTNPDIKRLLKENDGLGTEATRAATIELLLKRGFLKRRGKNGLNSTELGCSIVDIVPENLKDPGLTALWEAELKRVLDGTLAAAAFMEKQRRDLAAQIQERRGQTVTVKGGRTVRPAEGDGLPCPQCKQGTLVTHEIHKGDHKGKKFLSCSRRPDCDYRQWPGPPVVPLPGDGDPCPKCNQGTMRTRVVRKEGPNKGQRFLSCSTEDCKNFVFPDEKPVEKLPGDGERCAKCNTGTMTTSLVRKDGPYKGQRFLRCTTEGCKNFVFPEAAPVEPLSGDGQPCQVCRQGSMTTRVVRKEGPRKGQRFLCCTTDGCKNYVFPEDARVEPLPGDGKPCPKCRQGVMTTRRFIGKDGQPNGLLKCSRNPDCDHIEWAERKVAPLPGEGRKCEACGKGTMRTKEIPDKAKGGRIRILGCSRYPDCRNTEFQDDKKKTNGATGGARSSTAPRGRAVGRG